VLLALALFVPLILWLMSRASKREPSVLYRVTDHGVQALTEDEPEAARSLRFGEIKQVHVSKPRNGLATMTFVPEYLASSFSVVFQFIRDYEIVDRIVSAEIALQQNATTGD
jgi:hypothetical protein